MKTPSFWYPQNAENNTLAPFLLSPLAALFKAGTLFRRCAHPRPFRARSPVVCIGNAVAGGAGKTPVALALAKILKARRQNPIFVTRGYGGDGNLRRATAESAFAQVGDEALLLAQESPTWVCKNRVKALKAAEKEASVIIMDDGLQNPSFAPSASVLVIDGEVGLGNGRLIPAGPLREPFDSVLKRITCAVIIGEDRQGLAQKIKVPVFRARLEPQRPNDFPSGKFFAFAGIARPEKFFTTLKGMGLDVAEVREFPDHHPFNAQEIASLREGAAAAGARLITTEKDAVRLPAAARKDIFVLPVRLVFENPQAEERLAALALDFIPAAKS